MRILTLCTSANVFGAEVVTLKMLEGFKRCGHEQLAITTIWTDGEFSRRLANVGIPEVRLPFGMVSKVLASREICQTANVIARLPWFWYRWVQTVRRFRPDVVLFTYARYAMLLYPWLGGQPSYLIEYTGLEPSRFRRKEYAMLARKLTGFIAVSKHMFEHILRTGAPREQIHLIRSGPFSETDLLRVEAEAQAFVSAGDCLRIGIIGQIEPYKGHDCLVEAARLLKRAGRKFAVYVFGTGSAEYISAVKTRIATDGLSDCFHWMGYQKEKASIYGKIDVCVVPSCFGDPLPTVAMEAGAYGLPVVASRAGGLPEIVEQDTTGWIVNVNAAGELANRLEWLMDNRDAARQMGLAGRKRIFQEFTLEKMISQFEALFAESLAEPGSEAFSAPACLGP